MTTRPAIEGDSNMMKSILAIVALLLLVPGVGTTEQFMTDFWMDKFNDNLARAKQGDAEAQYTVANMHERGKGTGPDEQKALVWYQKAAEQGLDKAQYKIGYFHYKGLGVEKNLPEAIVWLRKAADQGYAPAQFYLGLSYAEGAHSAADYDAALKWLETARNNGYAAAFSKITEVTALRAAFTGQQRDAEKTAMTPTEPQSAIAPAPATVPEPKPAQSSRELLLRGGWRDAGKQPATHFPSAITSCQPTQDTIVCTTRKMNRTLPSADIVYRVETTIDLDQSTGKIYLVARNNVLSISNGEQGGNPTNIKPGWQYTKKYLDCEFTALNRIVCGQDGLHAVEYTREGNP